MVNAADHGADFAIPRAGEAAYNLRYSVLADGRLEAIAKATGMLRTGVKLERLIEAEQSIPGWWEVVLLVREDV